jgi:glycosyltransferase involved in cell wall biosynthesis
MGLGQLLQCVGQWLLKYGAPEGTRQHTLLRNSKHLILDYLIEPVRGRLEGWSKPVCPPLDIYRPEILNAFLRKCGGGPLEWSPQDAEKDELGAARFALGLLQHGPELRQQFRHALGEGVDGEFCWWLCSEAVDLFRLSATAVDHITTAFTRKLGSRPLRIYDHDIKLRNRIPLALTPAGQNQFLSWLFRRARSRYGLCDEEILWFLFETAEDSHGGLRATYLRTPEWQRQVPDPVYLPAWVRSHYGIEDDWLGQVDPCGLTEQPADGMGVNVLGHFCYPSGLGEAVHFMTRALERAGVQASCRDVPTHLKSDVLDHGDYLGLERFDCTLINVPPEPNLDGCYPQSGLAPAEGKYRIGIWYCELEPVPANYARHANMLREIWAPTQFIARGLRPVMPIPVIDMLPGVELNEVPLLPRSNFGLAEDRFLFLFVFDMRSVMERKNPLGLIHAFRKAFLPGEPAALVIKVTRGDHDPDSFKQLQRAAAEADVKVIDSVMSRAEAYGLMNLCDCYVSLHRSEGFGLTMAEAMLLGKPVIATAYSGNLDFMTPESSFLIDYQLVPITRRLPNYGKGALWAEPSVAQAAERMRWVYEHPEESQVIGEHALAETSRLLSLEAAGRRMVRRLQAIQGDQTIAPRIGAAA